MQSNRTGYAFISPWLLGFLIFTVFPFVASIYLSFCRYDIISPPAWVGTANYEELLAKDPRLWKALWNTLYYASVAVPLGIVAAFALALLLNLDVKGMSVYRTIFFLPNIVPAVATSIVFVWILNPQIGLVNGLLRHIGVEGPAWLNDTKWAMRSLIMMSLWGVGGSVIIYLAGLKDIPASLYEAAVVDGAGTWDRVRHVTIPMMTPVIFFNLIMGIIGAFQYFTQAFIMTAGGPEDSTLFYALYLFYRAWRYLDMGYASAMAWVLFVVVTTVTAVVFRTHRKWVHYGG
ncbi:MAG: sugar ABC transporter permease [Planctomycetota bacterium]|nr:sugar ABC transporter permease [Planctomycetota bacterium]